MNQPLLFHIGTPKSGTTSIQRAMRLLRTTFDSQYLYPGAIRTESHMVETCLILKEAGQPLPDLSWAPEIESYLNSSSLPDIKDLINSWSEECHTYKLRLSSPLFPPIVLSCEFAYEAFVDTQTLLTLKRLFNGLDVKFVIYIRPIDQHCNADFIQSLKYADWFGMESFYRMKTDRRGYLTQLHNNLPEILSNYQKIFGEGSLIVRYCEPIYLYKKNVVNDFFRLLGLELPDTYTESFQNKTVPFDFLIFFTNKFGNPVNRTEKSIILFDKLMTNQKLMQMQNFSSSFAYSPQERLEMLQSVEETYQIIGQQFDLQLGDALSRFKSQTNDEWVNAANLNPERCQLFQEIIDEIIAH